MPTESKDTPLEAVAASFARALIGGAYTEAYGLLTASLQARTSPAQLEENFRSMVDYGSGPANHSEVMNRLDEWPAKQADDIGWAYVAIWGDNFSEAVSVIVTQERDKNLISGIEWGRP